MLVQAYIQAVLENGLWVKFLGYFAGGISMYHLDKTYTSEELAANFKNGQKVPARIMHVDPENKSVSLSMKKSIIQMQPFAFDEINVGDIFDEAVVRRIDAPVGVLLEVKSTEDGEPILGYAHVSPSYLLEFNI
jgi:rRNA biogenesis protein RRP5